MREIKFRAWDKKKRKMYLVAKIDFAFLKVTCYEEGKALIGYKFDFRDIILMQYTGLKDKNGKEIYEADILSYEMKQGWEIFFEDGCYYMMYDGHSYLLEKIRAQISKIIGNKYENPELLNTAQA